VLTLRFWIHTCPRTGRRRCTRHRLAEDDARRCLVDPVPVDHDALTVEPLPAPPSGHWRSGLVQRTDGVLVADAAHPAPQPPA
jgi:hypothetical protein